MMDTTEKTPMNVRFLTAGHILVLMGGLMAGSFLTSALISLKDMGWEYVDELSNFMLFFLGMVLVFLGEIQVIRKTQGIPSDWQTPGTMKALALGLLLGWLFRVSTWILLDH